MKYDATITYNTDNDKMKFRVKFSEFPDFDRKKESWLNSRASFESIVKSEDTEDTLNEVLDNEKIHKDRLKNNEDCSGKNTNM